MTELTKQCLELSRDQKGKLIRLLQKSLIAPSPTDNKRFKELYEIAARQFGEEILSCRRDYNSVLGRNFIAYQMRNEGYSYSDIGRYLDRRHSSVMYM